MARSIANYLLAVLVLTAKHLLLLIGISAVLAWLMQIVNLRLLKNVIRLIGNRAYIWTIGWIGIPLHELGHAMFCIIFGHRIDSITLLDTKAKSGHYGNVRHSYNKKNPWHLLGNLFIGMAPIITGSALIWLLSILLLDVRFHYISWVDVHATLTGQLLALPKVLFLSIQNGLAILAGIFRGFSWKSLLFLYISFAIGTNINMSKMDLQHIPKVLIGIVILILCFNLATAWIGDFSLQALAWVENLFSIGYGVLIFVLSLCFFFLLLTFILNKLFHKAP